MPRIKKAAAKGGIDIELRDAKVALRRKNFTDMIKHHHRKKRAPPKNKLDKKTGKWKTRGWEEKEWAKDKFGNKQWEEKETREWAPGEKGRAEWERRKWETKPWKPSQGSAIDVELFDRYNKMRRANFTDLIKDTVFIEPYKSKYDIQFLHQISNTIAAMRRGEERPTLAQYKAMLIPINAQYNQIKVPINDNFMKHFLNQLEKVSQMTREDTVAVDRALQYAVNHYDKPPKPPMPIPGERLINEIDNQRMVSDVNNRQLAKKIEKEEKEIVDILIPIVKKEKNWADILGEWLEPDKDQLPNVIKGLNAKQERKYRQKIVPNAIVKYGIDTVGELYDELIGNKTILAPEWENEMETVNISSSEEEIELKDEHGKMKRYSNFSKVSEPSEDSDEEREEVMNQSNAYRIIDAFNKDVRDIDDKLINLSKNRNLLDADEIANDIIALNATLEVIPEQYKMDEKSRKIQKIMVDKLNKQSLTLVKIKRAIIDKNEKEYQVPDQSKQKHVRLTKKDEKEVKQLEQKINDEVYEIVEVYEKGVTLPTTISTSMSSTPMVKTKRVDTSLAAVSYRQLKSLYNSKINDIDKRLAVNTTPKILKEDANSLRGYYDAVNAINAPYANSKLAKKKEALLKRVEVSLEKANARAKNATQNKFDS